MIQQLLLTLLFSISSFSCAHTLTVKENFILVDDERDQIVLQLGDQIHDRFSPCSTFKIVLSLIGYDMGILEDEWNPEWNFQEGYLAYKESWKTSQTPLSWMKNSCVWYSQLLASQLGMTTIETYLKLLGYGNQNMSGGLTTAWLGSTLKISAAEQVKLIRNMVRGSLCLDATAIQFTKALLFLEELDNGWKLFGKRGWGTSDGEIGWLVGWIENGKSFYPFAYNIHGPVVDGERILPKVKELLFQSSILRSNNG